MSCWTKCCKCCCPFDLVIYICNSNALVDDDFDVKINGTTITTLHLNSNSCVGCFLTTIGTLTPAEFNARNSNIIPTCCIPLMTEVLFSTGEILSGTNVLRMQNIATHGNGNYGTVGIWRTNKDGHICQTLHNGVYSGVTGQSFNFHFNWIGTPPALLIKKPLLIRSGNKNILNLKEAARLNFLKKGTELRKARNALKPKPEIATSTSPQFPIISKLPKRTLITHETAKKCCGKIL